MRPSDIGLIVVGVALAAVMVFLAVDNSTTFWVSVGAGLALGSVYALISLGFVVVYRATGLLNFAEVGLVSLGAFLAFQVVGPWGGPWWLALLAATVACGAAGFLFQRVVLRPMANAPLFSQILATIGLFLLVAAVVEWIWAADATGQSIASPFGASSTFTIGDVSILQVDIVTMGLTGLVLGAFFLMFRFTRIGLAMRATAIDSEAALAQGINVNGVVALSWVIGGLVAGLAGVMLASGATPKVGLNPEFIALIGLAAFPAMILGGLDSPLGAIFGGLFIGLTQTLAIGFQQAYLDALGPQFPDVLPYLLMIVILLVRPYGLLGTPEVRRI